MSGQQHAPAALYPKKDRVPYLKEGGWTPGPVWTGGKSRPHRDSIPDRPARSQPLYRLSYPVHITTLVFSVLYEGESNENLKYVLSGNLLNTKGTQ